MSNPVNRFLGDSPLRVAIKLLLLSFVIGLLMSVLGLTPWEIVETLRNLILRVWNSTTLERFIGYVGLGAAVVIPIFLIMRLLSYRKK